MQEPAVQAHMQEMDRRSEAWRRKSEPYQRKVEVFGRAADARRLRLTEPLRNQMGSDVVAAEEARILKEAEDAMRKDWDEWDRRFTSDPTMRRLFREARELEYQNTSSRMMNGPGGPSSSSSIVPLR